MCFQCARRLKIFFLIRGGGILCAIKMQRGGVCCATKVQGQKAPGRLQTRCTRVGHALTQCVIFDVTACGPAPFFFFFFVFLSIQRSDCDEDEAYDCDEDHLPFLCLCPHIQNNQSFFFVPLFTFHILLSIIFLCTFVHVTLILQLDSCLPTCLAKTVCGVVYCGIWGFIGL